MIDFIKFLLSSLSIASGFFTIGVCTFLYIEHRTKILRLVFLFIASLLLISCGFWAGILQDMNAFPSFPALEVLVRVCKIFGIVLNVTVLPLLVFRLYSLALKKWMVIFLVVWDVVLPIFAFLYHMTPYQELFMTLVNVQLVITIGASLAVMLIQLKKLQNSALRRAIATFLGGSAGFLVLLILDLFITRLPISQLSALDNLSLPLYIIALNVGSFFFAELFLNKAPLIQSGRLTKTCVSAYGLTGREAEIVEHLVLGKTNQELADTLFISKKTVENHLYKIYGKMGLQNRMHLVQVLNTWKGEG